MHISNSALNVPPLLTTSSSSSGIGQPQAHAAKLKRVDTQDLKGKLATALGGNGKRYWSALLAFMTAKIDRTEFEEEAMMCLKPQHVHLHNSLLLGLLYNASADVPGPSARSMGGEPHERDASGQLVDIDGNVVGGRLADTDEDLEMLQPAKKRLRLLTAGLSRKERARIRNIPKQLAHSRSLALGGASSLGWAGAGADMLEKKRKEEEKRRSAEEKQRVKEAFTAIGAADWKTATLQGQAHVSGMHARLGTSTQQEISRALAMPLCVESKQLPDLDSMRDLMTLQAVETGLAQGAQPQAAALLLAALQCHLQNIMASILTKIRANRQVGIRTTGIRRSASENFALVTDADGEATGDGSFASSGGSPSPMHRNALRTMLHAGDTSSLSSSSTSLLGANGIMSGADSSMMSLASTAPTSVPAGSIASDNASNNGVSASSSSHDSLLVKPGGGNGGEDDEAGDLSMSGARHADPSAVHAAFADVTSNGEAVRHSASTLELRHLSFLLNLAPHTVVESLGQGSQERLLAADWTHADEDQQYALEHTSEGITQRQARLAATAKMSGVAAASGNASSSSGRNTPSPSTLGRNNYIIDQLAPVRLFDRRTLVESQAAANIKAAGAPQQQRQQWNKKGGLRLPVGKPAEPPSGDSKDVDGEEDKDVGAEEQGSADENKVDLAAILARRYGGSGGGAAQATSGAISPASSHQQRGQDSHLYDVVDPVALLASLVA